MAIDEQTRYEIYESFRGSYGEKVANGLMELLPPVGWADVATKHDLASLEERIDLRFELVESQFSTLRHELDARFAAVDARFDALDSTFDARFAAVDARFDALDSRFDPRFAAVDARFDALDSRFDARLERALRRQSTKFVAWLFAGLTLAGVAERLFP